MSKYIKNILLNTTKITVLIQDVVVRDGYIFERRPPTGEYGGLNAFGEGECQDAQNETLVPIVLNKLKEKNGIDKRNIPKDQLHLVQLKEYENREGITFEYVERLTWEEAFILFSYPKRAIPSLYVFEDEIYPGQENEEYHLSLQISKIKHEENYWLCPKEFSEAVKKSPKLSWGNDGKITVDSRDILEAYGIDRNKIVLINNEKKEYYSCLLPRGFREAWYDYKTLERRIMQKSYLKRKHKSRFDFEILSLLTGLDPFFSNKTIKGQKIFHYFNLFDRSEFDFISEIKSLTEKIKNKEPNAKYYPVTLDQEVLNNTMNRLGFVRCEKSFDEYKWFEIGSQVYEEKLKKGKINLKLTAYSIIARPNVARSRLIFIDESNEPQLLIFFEHISSYPHGWMLDQASEAYKKFLKLSNGIIKEMKASKII